MERTSFQLGGRNRGRKCYCHSCNVLKVGGLLLILATICSVPQARASHEDPPAWRLVKERCSLCHYLERQESKFAPSLKDLFKQKKLMNGKPVNEETVSEWITEGSANMPSFKDTLTPEQIRLIVNYIKDHPPLEPWR